MAVKNIITNFSRLSSSIIGLSVLALGIIAGIILLQNNQNINENAEEQGEYDLLVCPSNDNDPSCNYHGTEGIQYAINAAHNGNATDPTIILIKNGTYTNAGLKIFAENGPAKEHITLKGSGANTIINGGQVGDVIHVSGNSTGIYITGLTITNAKYFGVTIGESADAKVTNVIFYNNGTNQQTIDYSGGISINTNAKGEIINNVFYQNHMTGLSLDTYILGYNKQSIVKNNIFVKTKSYGNIESAGLYFDNSISVNQLNPLLSNNLFWENEGVCATLDIWCNTNGSLNNLDPKFVGSTDFHLQSSSPAINAGNPSISDPDGSRSDMGAYGGPGACRLDPNLPGCSNGPSPTSPPTNNQAACSSVTGSLISPDGPDAVNIIAPTQPLEFTSNATGNDIYNHELCFHGNFEGPGWDQGWQCLRDANPSSPVYGKYPSSESERSGAASGHNPPVSDFVINSNGTFNFQTVRDALVSSDHSGSELDSKGVIWGINIFQNNGICFSTGNYSTGGNCNVDPSCTGFFFAQQTGSTLPPSSSPPPTTEPTDNNVMFMLRFEGVFEERSNQKVQFEFIKDFLSFTREANCTSDINGIYSCSVKNVADGEYIIKVSGPVHLTKSFALQTINDSSRNKDFSGTKLLAGDSRRDGGSANFINAIDLGHIITEYFPNTPEGYTTADLNFDGKVNAIDLGYVIVNYFKKGD